MTHISEAPARVGSTAAGAQDCLLSSNTPPNTPNGLELQVASAAEAAKRALTREWLIESLAFARIYAENAQSFAELGDDTLALLSLDQFRKAARAACECGVELRTLREGHR